MFFITFHYFCHPKDSNVLLLSVQFYTICTLSFLTVLFIHLKEKTHYEGIMSTKVINDIQAAEAQHRDLEHNRMVCNVPLNSNKTWFSFSMVCGVCLFDASYTVQTKNIGSS